MPSRKTCSARWRGCAAKSLRQAGSPPVNRGSSPGSGMRSTVGERQRGGLPDALAPASTERQRGGLPDALAPASTERLTTPPVFFSPDAALAGDRITLTGPEGRHAATVRRLTAGERVDVTDGDGHLAECVVVGTDPGRLELSVLRKLT